MKIEDKLKILHREVTYGSGGGGRYCSVTDRPIGNLIITLRSQGVEVDPANCEAEIFYQFKVKTEDGFSFREVTREGPVPLRTQFNEQDKVRIQGYVLRGDELEIKLKNHYDSRYLGGPDVIGAGSRITSGIIANFLYQGDDSEEGAKIVERAKQIVGDFYNPMRKIAEAVESAVKCSGDLDDLE